MNDTQRGILYILLSVTGYAVLPVISKQLLARGVAPIDIAFWRYLIAVPCCWVLVLARGQMRDRSAPARPLPRLKLLLIGTLFAGEALSAFYGLERIPASTFVVLFYSYPAMVAILEFVFGERLSLVAWLALGLTLVGVALTAPDFSAGLSGDNLVGVLLALADALMVAVYFMVTSRLLKGDVDMTRASAWTVNGGLLALVVVVLLVGTNPPPAEAWGYMIALVLVSTVMPIFLLNAGLQKLGATRSAIIATFEPVLSIILAVTLLHEEIRAVQWLGSGLIIASVMMLQLRRSSGAGVAEPTPVGN